MNRRYLDPNFTPNGSASWRALMASGFWLRTGTIGAFTGFAALVALFRGDAVPSNAVALALAGMALAALAWRRAWVILDRAEEAGHATPVKAPLPMTDKYAEPLVLG